MSYRKMTHCYNLTEHSDFYKTTEWGKMDSKEGEPEVVENRNRFIKEYKIVRQDTTRTTRDLLKYINKHFKGRLEFYRNEYYDYVIVTSNQNYEGHVPPGFTKIYPLFGSDRDTYVGVFSLDELRLEIFKYEVVLYPHMLTAETKKALKLTKERISRNTGRRLEAYKEMEEYHDKRARELGLDEPVDENEPVDGEIHVMDLMVCTGLC